MVLFLRALRAGTGNLSFSVALVTPGNARNTTDVSKEKPPRRVLFVCGLNRYRSKTAEALYRDAPGFEVKSAGLDRIAKVQVSQELLDWAHIVVVMEKRQRNVLHKRFRSLYQRKRIESIDVDDSHDFADPGLTALLREKLAPLLGAIPTV